MCVCWFSLQLLSETFFILRRNEWDISIQVCSSSCKLPVTLLRVHKTFFADFLQILKYQISWKSTQSETSSAQTNVMKIIAVFCNSANTSKKVIFGGFTLCTNTGMFQNFWEMWCLHYRAIELVQIDAYVIGKKEGKLWELQPVRATEGRKVEMTYTEAMGIASSKNSLKKPFCICDWPNFLQPHFFTTTT